jgi:protein phosphatase PTC7
MHRTDDILLLATDGFSDNVWNRELEQIITLILKEDAALPSLQLAEKVAASCCHYARVCSFKQNKESPFEVEARQHNLNFRGGKVDDVCVIAVVVKGAVRESKL